MIFYFFLIKEKRLNSDALVKASSLSLGKFRVITTKIKIWKQRIPYNPEK